MITVLWILLTIFALLNFLFILLNLLLYVDYEQDLIKRKYVRMAFFESLKNKRFEVNVKGGKYEEIDIWHTSISGVNIIYGRLGYLVFKYWLLGKGCRERKAKKAEYKANEITKDEVLKERGIENEDI